MVSGPSSAGWLGAEAAVNLFVVLSIAIFYLAIQSLRIVLFCRSSAVIGALSIFAIYSLAAPLGLHQLFSSPPA